MPTALLVEDDTEIATSLTASLTQRGYVVIHSATAAPAMGLLGSTGPDVVLLDLGLPDMDGSTLLMMLRAVSSVPIIVLTARSNDAEIVRLLDLGADDYLVKPFSVVQLDARIRSVLRRIASAPAVIHVGSLKIEPDRREVRLDDRPVLLRRREYDILLMLARNAGRVVTRRELLQDVWGDPAIGDADARIDVHISAIRAALGESGNATRYLQTVRGVGLKLDDPQGRQ